MLLDPRTPARAAARRRRAGSICDGRSALSLNRGLGCNGRGALSGEEGEGEEGEDALDVGDEGAVKPGDEGDDVGVEGEDAGAVPLLVGGADGAGGSDDASFPPPLAPWPVELRAASISNRSVRA